MKKAAMEITANLERDAVRRSHSKNTPERLLSLAYMYPFRCDSVATDFSKFSGELRIKTKTGRGSS